MANESKKPTALYRRVLRYRNEITTILIPILCLSVTIYYQQKNWNSDQKIEFHKIEKELIKDSQERKDHIISLIFERTYKSRRLLSAFYGKDKSTIKTAKLNLSSTLEIWNSERHIIYSFIKNNYDYKTFQFFRDSIEIPLIEFSNLSLNTNRLTVDTVRFIWSKNLKKVNANAYIFYDRLQIAKE